ncbi:glycosyl hydrolase [Desulfosporosinus sp. Sb-LF]|uniref:glycosyl hydrolase n=1 Tax=Desulfosporosinus sp. Sb-LF TaxID=2560027 RepID=UPI00107F5D5E|nr:glycosyl hydrolase [Desulfosporosinus sp. Sb-LF]TGE32665.1 glycosyl hydrolase [Desulfosporosinus sp. Sb-LF]
MFNRRLMIFIVLFVLTLGALWWYWQRPGGESLHAGQPGISATRFTQSLNGSWDEFSSLRQAWTTESERVKGKNDQSFFTAGRLLTLPSSERATVVSKRFQVPGEWSSRTMLLTFNGVQGHANVYLNGITSGQKVGEFEGSGGADALAIPPKAFHYGEDNILVVELAGSSDQRAMFLGSTWPKSGRIVGDIRLEAVVDTIFTPPQVMVTWNETTAQVTLKTNLVHHGFSQEGPWTVYGMISDGSAGVAEQMITVNSKEEADSQPVTLNFTIPNAHRWSMQAPFLYQLHITVSNNQGDIDDLALPLGLRSIALAPGKWVLNDQEIPIKGVALTPQKEYGLRQAGELDSWLKSEQKKGINLVYFIGQLPDELWLQAADRTGMGLWVELPVELIPSNRLPQPDGFQKIIAEKMLHPSIWAWTVGKGLDADALTQTYFRQSAKAVQPDLAFALKTNSAVPTGLPAEQSLTIQGNKIQGAWGQVTVEDPATPNVRWVREPMAAGIWALLMIVLGWMSIRSVPWRYKEISQKKPRRRLRKAWFWDGLFVFGRVGTLAGLITSGLFRIPIHSSLWFSHLWPGIELLQIQSPWLIWTLLGVLIMLARLLQVGVVAPHLPNAPHSIGLVYWLERRYRWVVFIAISWALLPWGVPFYIPILGYIFLVCVFLPIRIRDIRRIGGHYLPFLWVPGIITSGLLVWVSYHFADWVYLWHMVRR